MNVRGDNYGGRFSDVRQAVTIGRLPQSHQFGYMPLGVAAPGMLLGAVAHAISLCVSGRSAMIINDDTQNQQKEYPQIW